MARRRRRKDNFWPKGFFSKPKAVRHRRKPPRSGASRFWPNLF